MTQGSPAPQEAITAQWLLLAGVDGKLILRRQPEGTRPTEQEWPSRAEAIAQVPASALPVPRAHGDAPEILAAWIEVREDLRELVLSDPGFAAATLGHRGGEIPRSLAPARG